MECNDDTTIVTAYFCDNESQEAKEYQMEESVKRLMKLNRFMVIYTEKENVPFLRRVRSEYNTQIVPLKYGDFAVYRYQICLDQLDKNITISDNLIAHEMLFFCERAVKRNYFRTKYFCWCHINSIQSQEDAFAFEKLICQPFVALYVPRNKFAVSRDSINAANKDETSLHTSYLLAERETWLNASWQLMKSVKALYSVFTTTGELERVKCFPTHDVCVILPSFRSVTKIDTAISTGSTRTFLCPPIYVTCQLSGDLGTQLGQIAMVLTTTWENAKRKRCIPILPRDIIQNHPNKFARETNDNYFSNILSQVGSLIPHAPDLLKLTFEDIYEEESKIQTCVLDCHKSTRFAGPFTTWEYFHHQKPLLVDLFRLTNPIQVQRTNELWGKILEKQKNTCTTGIVAIHFQRSDPNFRNQTLQISYYQKALKHMLCEPNSKFEDYLYVIFNDDPSCSKHILAPTLNVDQTLVMHLVQDICDTSNIQDFIQFTLIQRCDAYILSSTPTSWWIGYLGEGTLINKKFIAIPHSTNQTTPDHWTQFCI